MSLIVDMPKDVRKYEIPVFGPFTVKQAIYVAIGFTLYAIAAIKIPGSLDAKLLIPAPIAVFIGAFGYVKPDHTPMEAWFFRMLYRLLLAPKVRRKKNALSMAKKQLDPPIEKPKYSLKSEFRIYT